MGTDNLNNRSTAPTPELLGQINTDMLAVIRQAFEAGVIAGRMEILEKMTAQGSTTQGETL